MPVYEFLCRDCDSRYDDLVGIDASMDDQYCPDCKSSDVVKLYSPFRTKISNSSSTVQVDGCMPGPAGQGGGGCCGGGCGGCG